MRASFGGNSVKVLTANAQSAVLKDAEAARQICGMIVQNPAKHSDSLGTARFPHSQK
jgi:hypothetical protein